MAEQQAQAKEKELPTAGPDMMRYLRELQPFLAREGSTTTIGPDNSIKHSFKMPMEAKQALVGAREQTGLSDYKGLDPDKVIALMGMRDKLDQQARQEPLDMAQMNYQNALAGQANAQPQMKLMDHLARFMQQGQRGEQLEKLKGIPQAQTQATQDALKARAGYFNRMPQAGAGKSLSAATLGLPAGLSEKWEFMTRDKDGNPITPSPSQLRLFDKSLEPFGFEVGTYKLQKPKGSILGMGYGGGTIDVNVVVPKGGEAKKSDLLRELMLLDIDEDDAMSMLSGMPGE